MPPSTSMPTGIAVGGYPPKKLRAMLYPILKEEAIEGTVIGRE